MLHWDEHFTSPVNARHDRFHSCWTKHPDTLETTTHRVQAVARGGRRTNTLLCSLMNTINKIQGLQAKHCSVLPQFVQLNVKPDVCNMIQPFLQVAPLRQPPLQVVSEKGWSNAQSCYIIGGCRWIWSCVLTFGMLITRYSDQSSLAAMITGTPRNTRLPQVMCPLNRRSVGRKIAILEPTVPLVKNMYECLRCLEEESGVRTKQVTQQAKRKLSSGFLTFLCSTRWF